MARHQSQIGVGKLQPVQRLQLPHYRAAIFAGDEIGDEA